VILTDCTLRDGGFHTDWNFSEKFIKKVVNSLIKTEIDIIELGYKSPKNGGLLMKSNDGFLSSVIHQKAEFRFMLDLSDMVYDEKINIEVIDEVVKESKFFKRCRIAFRETQIEHLLECKSLVESKGYVVDALMMDFTSYSETSFVDTIKTLSDYGLGILYLSDSYSKLTPSVARKMFQEARTLYGGALGFHPHDGLGLAYANSLEALEAGFNVLDVTIDGFGRGAGNLSLEKACILLERPMDNGVIDISENELREIKKNNPWGASLEYFYGSIKGYHPLKTQKVLKESSGFFDFSENLLHGKKEYTSCVIIPARIGSSRFFCKPLAEINGEPMIVYVCRASAEAVGRGHVYVATDSEKISQVVRDYGYKVIMTSNNCITGTDRVAEASLEVDYDIYVNVQGDEPMVRPSDIQKVIDAKKENYNHVINCMALLSEEEDINNHAIPKVVTDEFNNLLYASRSAIPMKKNGETSVAHKQVCIYAFNSEELSLYDNKKTKNEIIEDIEVVRCLDKNRKVKMILVESGTYAVDYEHDIQIVERKMNEI